MTSLTVGRRAPAGAAGALAVGFAAAVAIRVAVAGPAGAVSVRAGLAFAVALGAMALVARPGARVTRVAVVAGFVGAVVLALPALVSRGVADTHPAGGFTGWALATAVVATAEEAFLRGALFDALERWRGSDLAVVGAAVAFALLHVPLYGWHVVPLDFAVGLALGALRLATGTWTAPALAHVGADLAGWWLV